MNKKVWNYIKWLFNYVVSIIMYSIIILLQVIQVVFIPISNQLITRAIRKDKITNVCVDITNTQMIDILLKYGFIEYGRMHGKMYLVYNDEM